MRISDWSSDVCSSDLAASEILPPVAGDRNDSLASEPVGQIVKTGGQRRLRLDARPRRKKGIHDAVPGDIAGLGFAILMKKRFSRRFCRVEVQIGYEGEHQSSHFLLTGIVHDAAGETHFSI